MPDKSYHNAMRLVSQIIIAFVLIGFILFIIHGYRVHFFFSHDMQPDSRGKMLLTPAQVKQYCGNKNIKKNILVSYKRNTKGELVYLCPLSGTLRYGFFNKEVIISK